jgi:hypothetical protein
VFGGYGLLAQGLAVHCFLPQAGAGPHQPHPHRARCEPECGRRLLRLESRDVHQFDHRAVAFRQRGQRGDQVVAGSFGIDPLEEFLDLVLV